MGIKNVKLHFEKIYETEADGVWRFCVWKTSSDEIAYDIVQECFMRYWDELAKGKEISNDKAFLFTVARRLVIDWYRKKKTESLDRSLSGQEDDPFEIPDDPSFESLEAGSEARYAVYKMKLLSPPNRQILYLRFVEGLEPHEVADILGVTANAASVRIHRALEELRSIMNPKQ